MRVKLKQRSNGLVYSDDNITPKEFGYRMSLIATRPYDPEAGHIEADDLICELLNGLGYGVGVAVFKSMDKGWPSLKVWTRDMHRACVMRISKSRFYLRIELLRKWAIYFWYYPKDWRFAYSNRGRYLFVGPIEIDGL
jgi:hypothetical protein